MSFNYDYMYFQHISYCLPDLLKFYRKCMRINQRQFADLLSVSLSSVSSWESGRRAIPLKVLFFLADDVRSHHDSGHARFRSSDYWEFLRLNGF